jgi:hypothetical protein
MRVANTVAAILALLAITCFSVFASANPLSPTPLATTADFLVVGFKCDLVNGKLVCGDKQGGKKQGNGDDDDDQPKKSKDKAITKTCGKKVNCEAGLVKLEKPNKYGACCEARQGVCPTGLSGTPPKCKTCGTVAAENGEAALDIFRNERPQCKGIKTMCQKVVNGTSDCCCYTN